MVNYSARDAEDRDGFFASWSRYWNRSYGSDYLGFALLLAGYLAIRFLVEPFHRMFSLDDLRISFPHAEVERVPLFLDFIYALFVPLGVLLLYNRLTSAPTHKHQVTVLGLAISMILAAFLTDVIKNAVGRPRPDLLDRCKPAAGTPHGRLVTIDVCTETRHHLLHDGWRSFPSGHSSFSFAGLGYLSLFLAGQLRVFSHGGGGAGKRAEKVVRGDLLRALFCILPLFGAMMIAISRVQDYRHDVYDVSVGALLGWSLTYWSYRRYWPRLSSPCCNEPYSSPIGDSNAGYGPVRDVEEGLGANAD